MGVLKVTWRCSEPIEEIEGYVLASYIRIAGTGKPYGERPLTKFPQTALTESLVDKVAGPWAFLMAMVHEKRLKTTRDVDDFMLQLNTRMAETWLNAHEREAAGAKRYLSGLVGKFSCTG
ncbi:MAG: hypothetical protein HY553_10870 [Elusimicrobia bacterium]|nr:hypothetical protein [Elusimicrobiota bacterium]